MFAFKLLKPVVEYLGARSTQNINILSNASNLLNKPISITLCNRYVSQSTAQAIQDISSLQLKKRGARKKRTLDEEIGRPPGLYDTVAFSTAEEYNLEALVDGLKQQNLYEPKTIDNNSDVVHAVAKIQVASEPREIFFFREGSVVLWNVTDLESSNVLSFLRKYENDSYTDKLVQMEVEIMNYKHQEAG